MWSGLTVLYLRRTGSLPNREWRSFAAVFPIWRLVCMWTSPCMCASERVNGMRSGKQGNRLKLLSTCRRNYRPMPQNSMLSVPMRGRLPCLRIWTIRRRRSPFRRPCFRFMQSLMPQRMGHWQTANAACAISARPSLESAILSG